MGSGIVSLVLQSSISTKVNWWVRDIESTNVALIRIKKEARRYCKKYEKDLDEVLAKLHITDDLDSLQGTQFYLEAIIEDMDKKAELVEQVSSTADQTAVFATNTSSLSITALSMHFIAPENVIGMHFFNPTSMMELVEVVKGLNTSTETIEKTVLFAKELDKSPVLVNESPGFIVNRMLIPMINEAVTILAEGVATKEDIDKAMKLGANHPLGPLSLADLIGNDVCLSIMETLHQETGDPKYRAHPLLRQYVRAGFLGRKSKKGFYDYRK